MPASVSARNYGAYYARNNGASYRTRAAVLCFGGWGLQTMLHLWPRIRLIQEEREVLGIDRELPNLDRLTAFAAILPETGPASGTLAIPPFHVLQPNFERYPAPFYLQRQLASIETEVAEAPDPGLTHAERVGAQLLKRVREDGYVRPLSVSFSQPSNGGAGQLPASRAETFRTGIGAAGATVRALLSQVIDPTRLDSMQTRDPFVQTTIYVIAPLSEPRASALVWPVVSELVGTLRRRHVARVIAFFSTASFAPDDGRAIEEATVHMSLREIEALSDPSARDEGSGGLSRLIVECGGAVWGERMGRRLFDMAYLIDREKSNQALAESALELSTLVGNTIEAFLAADGLGHIEKSLGPDTAARSTGHSMTGRPTYSVLGAACDHVPLAEHIASAIEEEQKQLVHSTVLAPRIAGGRSTGHCFRGGRPACAGRSTGRTHPPIPRCKWETYVRACGRPALPRLAPGVTGHREIHPAEGSRQRAAQDKGPIAMARAAGKSCRGGIGRGRGGSRGDGRRCRIDTESEDRSLAAEQVVADLCSAPDGILRARARLSSWRGAVGSLLRDLQRKTGDRDGGEPYRSRLDAWQREYANAAETYQQTVALWVRIVVLACFGALALAGAMLLQRGPRARPRGPHRPACGRRRPPGGAGHRCLVCCHRADAASETAAHRLTGGKTFSGSFADALSRPV